MRLGIEIREVEDTWRVSWESGQRTVQAVKTPLVEVALIYIIKRQSEVGYVDVRSDALPCLIRGTFCLRLERSLSLVITDYADLSLPFPSLGRVEVLGINIFGASLHSRSPHRLSVGGTGREESMMSKLPTWLRRI